MTFEETVARLQEKFGDAVEGADERDAGRPGLLLGVYVRPEAVVDVCRYLHDTPELAFEQLSCITGTDFQDHIQLAYVMMSYAHREVMAVKVKLDRDEPSVHTVEGIWATANWHEREVYDLLGVYFEGHSDLRRLLMPDDWVGHPLRKDYKEEPDYHGIPTTRDKALGKY